MAQQYRTSAGQSLSDPYHQAEETRRMLKHVRDRIREDVLSVEDARGRALFETTAEVLGGLISAFEHYESGVEVAWRRGH